MSADPKTLLERYATLLAKRQEIDADVQSILSYVQPQKANILKKSSPNVAATTAGLYDMTANHANLVLAAGLMSTATPTSSRWAQLQYPGRNINGRPLGPQAKKWYQEATEEVMDEIARSNFYTELHEGHLDRSSAGTSFVFMDEGKRSFFNFSAIPFGEYVIAEDAEGQVDTVFREYEMSARNAAAEFGLENLPDTIKEAATKKPDSMFCFVHFIGPRLEYDASKQDGQNKPVASCYIAKEAEKIVRESGFDEFPGAVSRYLKWPGTVYGFGPGFVTLPTERQVNFIERQLDALAEKAAFPPVLIPSNLYGQVDSRAAGQTIFDENFPQALPREWQQTGRYDIGKDRVAEKQKFIRDAFHNDLFQMFGQIERDMTAFEAMQRASEKLDLISPAFTRLSWEMLSPIIMRGFRMKLRAGQLGTPPEELVVRLAGNRAALREPKVVYVSKLALAIKSAENRAFLELQQIFAGVVPLKPDVLDNVDLDKAIRGVAENLSLPTAWIADPADVAAMRQERAEAAQAAAAAQNAPAMARAAKDVDSISADGKNRLAQMTGSQN